MRAAHISYKPGVLAILFGMALFSSPLSRAGTDRWAVVAGNNYGGSQRLPLQFAEEDARRLAGVLERLGHFPGEQIELLLDATPRQMLDSIRSVPGDRDRPASLLVVYYSGHADGQSLLLGEDRLGLAELKAAVDRSRAEVALIILDACNAGAAIGKGGHSAPSFLRFTDSQRARGRIILTSASASELAQESDQIAGSFFTHYLVSGLTGDADRSGDRRVSLEEIYRYVYDQTVHRTANTLPGVQHPAFSYDLKGEGSIVLTDLNNESTSIRLPRGVRGNYLLYDDGRRAVVAELHKPRGQKREIPLSPGRYTLKKRTKEHLLVADLELSAGQRLTVRDSDMRKVPFDHPESKGWDLRLGASARRWEAQALASWTAFSIDPAGGLWSYPSGGLALRYRGWPAPRWAVRLALTAGYWNHENPVQDRRIPYALVQLGSDLSLGRVLRYGPFGAEAGARLHLVLLRRQFSQDGLDFSDQTAGLGAGPYGQISVRLGPIRLSVELSGGLFFFAGAKHSVIPFLASGMALSLGI